VGRTASNGKIGNAGLAGTMSADTAARRGWAIVAEAVADAACATG